MYPPKNKPETTPDPAEQVSGLSREELATEIRSRYTALYKNDEELLQEILEEDLPKAVEREVQFVQAVVDAYQRWSQEDEVVVLWDIDETLGIYSLPPDEHAMVWRFRPSVLSLMDYLQKTFPQVKNGLLSDRTHLQEQLEEAKYLGPIADFIDAEFLFSCRDVPVLPQERTALEEELAAIPGVIPSSDHLNKTYLLRGLKDRGVNVKVIDDNKVADTWGEAGLRTYHLMPKV